jgi:hypothetical protein
MVTLVIKRWLSSSNEKKSITGQHWYDIPNLNSSHQAAVIMQASSKTYHWFWPLLGSSQMITQFSTLFSQWEPVLGSHMNENWSWESVFFFYIWEPDNFFHRSYIWFSGSYGKLGFLNRNHQLGRWRFFRVRCRGTIIKRARAPFFSQLHLLFLFFSHCFCFVLIMRWCYYLSCWCCWYMLVLLFLVFLLLLHVGVGMLLIHVGSIASHVTLLTTLVLLFRVVVANLRYLLA